jgi:hypothetical protein
MNKMGAVRCHATVVLTRGMAWRSVNCPGGPGVSAMRAGARKILLEIVPATILGPETVSTAE